MDTFDPAAVTVLQHPGAHECVVGSCVRPSSTSQHWGGQCILSVRKHASLLILCISAVPTRPYAAVQVRTLLGQCMLTSSMHASSHLSCVPQCILHCRYLTHDTLCCAGAHFVPTCSGEYKQQLVAFLDRFKAADSSAGAAAAAGKAKASASVGSSLASMSLEEVEPQNESAEDAGLATEAARL